MVTVTAQQVMYETNYSEEQIRKEDLESLIDNCIRWINLMAGQSMSLMAGVAGAKTTTVTDNQYAVLIFLVSLVVKANLNRGSTAAVGGLSVGVAATDPQTGQMKPMYKAALQMLRGRGFDRV